MHAWLAADALAAAGGRGRRRGGGGAAPARRPGCGARRLASHRPGNNDVSTDGGHAVGDCFNRILGRFQSADDAAGQTVKNAERPSKNASTAMHRVRPRPCSAAAKVVPILRWRRCSSSARPSATQRRSAATGGGRRGAWFARPQAAAAAVCHWQREARRLDRDARGRRRQRGARRGRRRDASARRGPFMTDEDGGVRRPPAASSGRVTMGTDGMHRPSQSRRARVTSRCASGCAQRLPVDKGAASAARGPHSRCWCCSDRCPWTRTARGRRRMATSRCCSGPAPTAAVGQERLHLRGARRPPRGAGGCERTDVRGRGRGHRGARCYTSRC